MALIKEKEMVYTKNRYDEPIVLAHENYHGRDFYITSFGTHPCAYIDVSNLLNITQKEQNYILNVIECHGGITYSDSKLPSVTDKKGWFIGWDYAHCTDYTGGLSFNNFGTAKKWTTLEIIIECKTVIDQLAEIIKILPSYNKLCGKWVNPHWKNNNFCYNCSMCNAETMHSEYKWAEKGIYPFCPNCGIKMNG